MSEFLGAVTEVAIRVTEPRSSRYSSPARQYIPLGKEFAEHHTVKHSIGEYVRGDAHTNTIEGYFSIFKRGMTGVYQHCSPEHLKRYLAEFDMRYNERELTDSERTAVILRGIQGKRLTYRWSDC